MSDVLRGGEYLPSWRSNLHFNVGEDDDGHRGQRRRRSKSKSAVNVSSSGNKSWFLQQSDCFQDASGDFRSLATAGYSNANAVDDDDDKDEFFSLSHIRLEADGKKKKRSNKLFSSPFANSSSSRHVAEKKENGGSVGSKISYDSTGPNDERYYVPINDVPQEEDDEHHPPNRVQSPSKRQIEKHRKESRSKSRSGSSNSSHDIGCRRRSHHCRSDSKGEEEEGNVRNLKRLFSKSTSALGVAVETKAEEEEVIPDPDYSPLVFRKTNDQTKMGRRQTTKKPSLDLWSNAQRYRGSLEDLQESTGADYDEEDEDRRMPLVMPRETMKTALKNRPPVREFVSLLAQQQQIIHERSGGKRSLFFNPMMDQRLRHKNDDSSNSRMSSARSSEDREEEEEDKSINTIRMYREILRAMDRKEQRMQLQSLQAEARSGNGRMLAYDSSQQKTSQPQRARSGPFSRLLLTQSEEDEEEEDIETARNSALNSRCFHRMQQQQQQPKSLFAEVQFKQSHFFNNLFPSRANRFGYPVYPERELGIPSSSGPVSFAGFSPPGSTLSAAAAAIGPSSIQSKESGKKSFFKKWFSH